MGIVSGLCVDGADIAQVCIEGDTHIEEAVGKVYAGKKSKGIEKGIAFPTSVSKNEICGHFAPFREESAILKQGDVVKM